jgi:hypothetical protein
LPNLLDPYSDRFLSRRRRSNRYGVLVSIFHIDTGAYSNLAVTLVAPSGRVVGSWRSTHPPDETVDPTALHASLDQINEIVEQRGGPQDVILVLGDGRILENESPRTYLEPVSRTGTVQDFRKAGNPQIMTGSTASEPPCAVEVPGTQTLLFAPTPVKTGAALPAERKVILPSDWFQLGMTNPRLHSSSRT